MTRFAERQDGARRQWLLGIGFALVGLGAWWQLHRLPDDEAVQAPRERRPDYIVQGLSALETDATGEPSRRLKAERLRHYADEDLSELDEPRLVLYRPDGPPWFAQARLGTVQAEGDQVQLSGAVRLDREADASNRPMHLETERLDIWRQTGLAETDLPVRIDSDGDWVTANGMRLWYLQDAARTSFYGRARIRISPEHERTPDR
ncbi:LPS export ABC transporter periplasmic protein LptC [Allochromatium palmeri]|uniref:LPS export ABC transporter periplasmic protein LptC n=1 Tax=Allochromatium palmeri TaxID=231048 RepID=A0A6N8E7V3_9GAMM|nr:LPS export ABC transporter periplasmic protein LptC [Allochromatium palmeri]MTW20235.1 LPS export ABC transporter periplasmic protein LptC [Allochromatium palmeri]